MPVIKIDVQADIQMLWTFDPNQPIGITHEWKKAIHASYKQEIPQAIRDGFAFQKLPIDPSGLADQADIKQLLDEELLKLNQARQQSNPNARPFALVGTKPAAQRYHYYDDVCDCDSIWDITLGSGPWKIQDPEHPNDPMRTAVFQIQCHFRFMI